MLFSSNKSQHLQPEKASDPLPKGSSGLGSMSMTKNPAVPEESQSVDLANRKQLLAGDRLISDNGVSLYLKESILWVSISDQPEYHPAVNLGLTFTSLNESEQIDLLTRIRQKMSSTPKDELIEAPLLSCLAKELLNHSAIEQVRICDTSLRGKGLITLSGLKQIELEGVRISCPLIMACDKLTMEEVVFAGSPSLQIHSQKGAWNSVSISENVFMSGDFGETVVDENSEIKGVAAHFNFRNGNFPDAKSWHNSFSPYGIQTRFTPPEFKDYFQPIDPEEFRLRQEKIRDDFETIFT